MHWYTWLLLIVGIVANIFKGIQSVTIKVVNKKTTAEQYNPANDPNWHDENGIPW